MYAFRAVTSRIWKKIFLYQIFPFISREQVAIRWSPKSTPPHMGIVDFNYCAKFFVCHRPSDLTFLSTWPISKPSGIVDSRWTNFLSFHVTQTKLSLCWKRGSPLFSLLTCSLLRSTMSFGRNFLFPLTVPQASIPLLSSSKNSGTLVYQLTTNNLYPLSQEFWSLNC